MSDAANILDTMPPVETVEKTEDFIKHGTYSNLFNETSSKEAAQISFNPFITECALSQQGDWDEAGSMSPINTTPSRTIDMLPGGVTPIERVLLENLSSYHNFTELLPGSLRPSRSVTTALPDDSEASGWVIPPGYVPTEDDLWKILFAYRSKDVMFHLPAKTENMPHRDSILKITDTDGTFIACSQVPYLILQSGIVYNASTANLSLRGLPMLTCYIIR